MFILQYKMFPGMVTAMDEAIGNVTKALQETGIMDDAVIIFTTDVNQKYSLLRYYSVFT